MPNPTRLRIDEYDGVKVVRFTDRQLFDDRTVREASAQLQGILTGLKSGDGLVVDLSGVQTISSAMVGQLVLLQRRADGLGAQLRLCELNEVIASVMRTTNLDRIFTIDRDARGALAALQEGSRS